MKKILLFKYKKKIKLTIKKFTNKNKKLNLLLKIIMNY